MKIGVPREVHAGEKRVATTPEVVGQLIKLGYEILVESGAGQLANYADEAYEKAGAKVVQGAKAIWDEADIILKVRGPEINPELNRNEVDLMISVTHHKSFWEKMVKHSLTKDLTTHCSIPTLIIHKDDEQSLNQYIDSVTWPLVLS